MASNHTAEQRLINDWRLDPRFFCGVKLGLLPWQQDSFEFRQAKRVKVGDYEESFEAIEMMGDLRFGNSFISLVHALTVAHVLGIEEIFCPHDSMKFSGQIGNIRVTRKADESRNRLCGTFYYPHLLKPLLSRAGVEDWWESPFASNPDVFALYGVEASQPPLGEDDLVIHLRSGDIFESRNPHPSYGQPPLSFFKKVVETNSWERVFLVYENETNPVVRSLQNFLDSKKIPFVVSSKDVVSDIHLCLRSGHLVLSAGTFLWPVVGASSNLKATYLFERSSTWILEPPPPQGQQGNVNLSSDRVGIYRHLVLRKWSNSRFQRFLMRWYPGWWVSTDPPPRRFE